MKATIEIPDDLYRKIQVKSGALGKPLQELTINLLEQWLSEKEKRFQELTQAGLDSRLPAVDEAIQAAPSVILRRARSEDVPALVPLLQSLFSQEEEFAPNGALQERGLRAILSDPRLGDVLLAEEDGRAIGMVSLLYTVSTALGAPVAILEDMVVDPSRRGAGIGSAILARALRLCRERGCARVTLLTDARNTGAQRFYEKAGFAQSVMIPLRLILREEARS